MRPDLSKVKYVLFDWDGTLSDNRDIVVAAVGRTLEEYGLPGWEQMKRKRDDKLSLWDNFANVFGADWRPAYARYVEIYKKLIPSMVKSFPGAAEVLRLLKDDGAELMIMTNKDPQLLEIELPLLYDPALFPESRPGTKPRATNPGPIIFSIRSAACFRRRKSIRRMSGWSATAIRTATARWLPARFRYASTRRCSAKKLLAPPTLSGSKILPNFTIC